MADESKKSALYSWVDERLGLDEALKFAKKKQVPLHKHSMWYYLGGVSLFLFIVQCVTGVLLLVYYRPGPDAYASVQNIEKANFGWLIRSTHSWSANLMVAAVVIHMFSVYFMKAYRKPREFGWWTGLVLLGLTLLFGFSGYLLPMDELAYFATKIGLEIPAKFPVIGEFFANLLRGGPEVGPETVHRFFTLHVVILPFVFMGVLMFHLWLVQRHGNAIPPSEESVPVEKRKAIPFFPNFFMKDLAIWLICMNVLTFLAAVFPWELGQPADPLASAPEGIHPEWFFMSAFHALKVIGHIIPGLTGELVGMGIFTVALVLWALIPLYDRDSSSGKRARVATWFGVIFLMANVILTVWGYAAL